MFMKRVLIVNKTFPTAGVNILKKKVETTVLPYNDYDPECLPHIKKNLGNGYDGLIWNTKHKLTGELLDLAGPKLCAISTMSSGTDQVEVDEVKKRNIPLGNTLRVLDDAVADIALGLLVAAARRFKEGIADIENNEWKIGVNWTLGQDIAGTTVGVVGLGGIGQSIVRRLHGFGVARFLYSGRTQKPEAKELKAEYVDFHQLLRESDHVILVCPLTAETKHMINENTLRMMKKNAVLINVARGDLIDQNALIKALKEDWIFSAGLDVTTPEPLSRDHPLLALPNCCKFQKVCYRMRVNRPGGSTGFIGVMTPLGLDFSAPSHYCIIELEAVVTRIPLRDLLTRKLDPPL
ncbi:hypothetical protein EVAR_78643_1 [Eumeta japonica]|uniref:Glyoxylate reductase/hydroxypyruvate reductase n=1 Tax=Eumeta variegata TaxID=151549 RepID=A0A4C1U8M5_EUMVA|nr:hypothetical protein EVAR_78643_1 [Eumeta japonica]